MVAAAEHAGLDGGGDVVIGVEMVALGEFRHRVEAGGLAARDVVVQRVAGAALGDVVARGFVHRGVPGGVEIGRGGAFGRVVPERVEIVDEGAHGLEPRRALSRRLDLAAVERAVEQEVADPLLALAGFQPVVVAAEAAVAVEILERHVGVQVAVERVVEQPVRREAAMAVLAEMIEARGVAALGDQRRDVGVAGAVEAFVEERARAVPQPAADGEVVFEQGGLVAPGGDVRMAEGVPDRIEERPGGSLLGGEAQ